MNQQQTAAQAAAEWEASKDIFLKMGLSKAAFVRSATLPPERQLASARDIPNGFIGTLSDLDGINQSGVSQESY